MSPSSYVGVASGSYSLSIRVTSLLEIVDFLQRADQTLYGFNRKVTCGQSVAFTSAARRDATYRARVFAN